MQDFSGYFFREPPHQWPANTRRDAASLVIGRMWVKTTMCSTTSNWKVAVLYRCAASGWKRSEGKEVTLGSICTQTSRKPFTNPLSPAHMGNGFGNLPWILVFVFVMTVPVSTIHIHSGCQSLRPSSVPYNLSSTPEAWKSKSGLPTSDEGLYMVHLYMVHSIM